MSNDPQGEAVDNVSLYQRTKLVSAMKKAESLEEGLLLQHT
jgi:hypothetical protein